MINALIVEDENPAAQRLQKMLNAIDKDISIVGIVDSVKSAVEWLKTEESPDLIFMDIQLGDGLSFNIFNEVAIESWVIFITAYDEYAIRAFEVNSVDYLLKPLKEENLARSIDKYKSLSGKSSAIDIDKVLLAIQHEKQNYKKRFMINLGTKIKSINTSDIISFYLLDKATYAFTNEGRSYPVDYSLDRIEEMVCPEDFFRINRQTIVNHSGINKISVFSKSRIRIETSPASEIELMVSSKKSHTFRLWLDK